MYCQTEQLYGITNQMNLLDDIFCSRVRAAIFAELFGLTGDEIHLRELQRRTGFALSTVRQDIRKLQRLGLVTERRDGNRLYYTANKKHQLFLDIRQMVLKTSGLTDILAVALDNPEISYAFVFGSFARGEASTHSDIDLMVIGSITLKKLAGLLYGVSDKLGREINPYVISTAEFAQRIKGQEHFISTVMDSEKIYVIGTEHELEAMV